MLYSHEGDDGHAGFAFPNCLGDLNVTVSGTGTPPPTGAVTLGLTGGIYNGKSAVLGTVGIKPCTSPCMPGICLCEGSLQCLTGCLPCDTYFGRVVGYQPAIDYMLQ